MFDLCNVLLKLNDLANLQDARAGAAWGADYITFRMERGALLNINEALVREIAPWLSGPIPVLAWGSDVENAQQHRSLLSDLQAISEYDALIELPPRMGSYGLRLQLTHKLNTAEINRLYTNLPEAAYLDVHATDPVLLAELLPELPAYTLLLVNVDGLASEALADVLARHTAEGISFGQKMDSDFTWLDYDALERLLERVRP